MNKIVLSHIALVFLNLIYGSTFFIAKEVMPKYLTPNFFIFIRVLGATLLFALIRLVIREKIDKKDVFRMALCGLFGIAANQLLFFQGLSQTSATDSSIIMVTTPVLVTVFSFIILKNKLTTSKIIGVLMGLLGASYLIYLGANNGNKEASFIGNLFVFLNATSYAIYIVIVKPLMVKYKPITVISTVFAFGLLYVIPFGLNDISHFNLNMPLNIWLAIGFVIFFTTLCTYLLNAFALSHLQPTVTASYIYLQPFFAMLTGVVFSLLSPDTHQNVSITIPKILATAFIFLGVYIISKSPNIKLTKNKAIS